MTKDDAMKKLQVQEYEFGNGLKSDPCVQLLDLAIELDTMRFDDLSQLERKIVDICIEYHIGQIVTFDAVDDAPNEFRAEY